MDNFKVNDNVYWHEINQYGVIVNIDNKGLHVIFECDYNKINTEPIIFNFKGEYIYFNRISCVYKVSII